MLQYVKVVPVANIPLGKNQFFTYKSEEEGIQIGQEVAIPFRERRLRGIVWSFEEKKPPFRTKKIIALPGEEPILDLNHRKLALWISDYYHCSLGLAVKLMLPPTLKRGKRIVPIQRRKNKESKIRLTASQNKIFKTISCSKERFFLLHGVTGSGKTEIYLRLCRDTLKQGKQAIVLVPEISLTEQAIDRFNARFPGKIALLHSRLSKSERFEAWERARTGKAKIIIGPRSAIFAPVENPGLIILDEEHDSSFKQYDQAPRYHAREVALQLAKIAKIKLILGSATPSLESYFAAQKGNFELLELPQRIGKEEMPYVEIVDMRMEFKKGHGSILSEKLKEKLNKIIVQEKQAIIFVNRRGAASFIFCRDCGYVLECPRCNVSLTYHLGAQAHLLCHYCNYTLSPPPFCPRCQGPYIKYSGLGTERVEREIQEWLPRARIARFDRDSTIKKEAQSRIYNDFRRHKIDILVGTQMLAQGWDLPKVALIGIISADLDLNLPDFRASERTFNLLTQVAGRTGRGKEIGEVVLQTYNPDNFVIWAAARHDYQAFYREELKNRRELSFPPFSNLVKLLYQHYHQEKAEKEAQSLARKIRTFILRRKLPITLLGPASCFVPRIRRRYRHQIILMFKGKAWKEKSSLLSLVPLDWIVDVDPESLL